MTRKIIQKNKEISKIVFKKEELAKEVENLSGENLFGCYQCGTCSAGCPYVDDMDLTPDEVIRYIILGRSEVLNSKTIWLCSACLHVLKDVPEISILQRLWRHADK